MHCLRQTSIHLDQVYSLLAFSLSKVENVLPADNDCLNQARVFITIGYQCSVVYDLICYVCINK